jgi:hypothetical protein
MQSKTALQLKKSWGNKPCEHPEIEKEYYLGSATGDYICIQCGKAGTGSSWNKSSHKKPSKGEEE